MKPWEQYQQPESAPWESYQAQPEQVIEQSPDQVQPEQVVEKPWGSDVLGTLKQSILGSGPFSMDSDVSRIARERILKPATTMATGIPASITSGVAGTLASPFIGTERAEKEVMQPTQKAMTYQPETQEAQETLSAIGKTLEPVAEAVDVIPKAMGDFTLDLTGSPAAATLVYSAPYAALEFLGLKGLKSVRKGTRLLDDAGRPTKELRKALDKKGLDYDSLTPEAKQMIPAISDPKLIPGANVPKSASEKALIAQIKSGGRDDALAGLRVVGDRINVDDIAKETLRQGFEPGDVQMIKTASSGTKKRMQEMTSRMRMIKKNSRLATKFRPSDVVGASVNKRINFIRGQAKFAGNKLDNIAKTRLPGKTIDPNIVTKQLDASLKKYDINVTQGADGLPKPDFTGSLISKDRASQRIIKDVVDLLSEGGAPDALKAHKLKRQLDTMLDYSKTAANRGLTKAGKEVAQDVRRALNNAVRSVDDKYAKANDILSSSLDTLDTIDKATGTIDLMGDYANAGLGVKMRALLSNQQGRSGLMEALDKLDNTAKKLGGKFDDNVVDLATYANVLDKKFGAVAETGFQKQIQQGVEQALGQGIKETAVRKGIEKGAKVAEKLRGVNEFNAFESISDLIKRK